MSEREREQGPAEDVADPVEAGQTPAAAPAKASRRSSPGPMRTVLWLAGLLILILAGVALSPFWAPELAALLPWSENRGEYAALAGRVAALEARPASSGKEIDAVKSALNVVTQHVDQLQTRFAEIEKRSPPPSVDIDTIGSALKGLTGRVDRLEAAAKPDRQIEDAIASVRAGMQQLDQRLTAIEAQSASRVASETAASTEMHEQLARLGKADADLADRVTALEREGQAQGKADLRADGMLALLLGQMREAVEQARPFPAEFNAFVSLARNPDLASAAEPLAEPARNGVASRAVLAKKLAELAGRMAVASEPAGDSDWGAQTLARLRSLVTIRRIEGPSQTGSEAAVSAAQTALARGDLAGAVAALDPLAAANAEAAGPWMRMARERLAAEAALDHLQELLTARLGSAPAAPAAAPANSPDQPSEKARTRS